MYHSPRLWCSLSLRVLFLESFLPSILAPPVISPPNPMLVDSALEPITQQLPSNSVESMGRTPIKDLAPFGPYSAPDLGGAPPRGEMSWRKVGFIGHTSLDSSRVVSPREHTISQREFDLGNFERETPRGVGNTVGIPPLNLSD
ncbi:hypothetical protein B0H11DRAFT_1933004 [Mycena galericulata]|nr:hypothetical protein B0H11DRAFT_1933004 [Mycena galericulata]